MKQTDLSALDLNLLVVLDVLLDERHVTRAAHRLHRTQSAISHALGRLRVQLGDPLLVRVGSEMRPTPRAQRLAGEVGRLLRSLGRLLGQEAAFDPATTDRVFTVAAPDYLVAALPALLARLSGTMPQAGVELVPVTSGMLRDVAEGRLDLAVGSQATTAPDGVASAPLATLDWAVYARADHPAIAQWSTTSWAAAHHLRVRTGEGAVERAARAQGLIRSVGPSLPHFLLAPSLLARSDLVLTLPRALLGDAAPRFGLVALPCPLAIAPVELTLFWSTALERDPAVSWLREAVVGAAHEALAPAATAP